LSERIVRILIEKFLSMFYLPLNRKETIHDGYVDSCPGGNAGNGSPATGKTISGYWNRSHGYSRCLLQGHGGSRPTF
jgi:hypothetical protein